MSENNNPNIEILSYLNKIRFKSTIGKRYNLGDLIRFNNDIYIINRRELRSKSKQHNIEKEYFYEAVERSLFDHEYTDLYL